MDAQAALISIAATKFLAVPRAGSLGAWHGAGFKDAGERTLHGYCSLSSAQIMNAKLPQAGSKLSRNVPLVRQGRLAGPTRLKGRGFGTLLAQPGFL